ncbi:MAG: hypothetical protein HY017_09670 [Betaproteobacteria bacterium]|nr:hypothetical protein [Betaproteobacteria bacterium]
MTLFLIIGLIIWLLLGCAVAYLIGGASDLGRPRERRARVTLTRIPQ